MKDTSKKKLIYTSYSPNTRKEDLNLNIKLFLRPFSWKNGNADENIKSYFKKYYPQSSVFLYNYARSALYHFFMNQHIDPGDEIIYQGFTCSAAVLPAMWAGLTPRYCDIDPNTLCIDSEELRKLISPATKYVVMQHTLGCSPDIEEVRSICTDNGIILIEDCTHFLPSSSSSLIGTFGDVSIFSFGRDKVISGVDGGVLMVNEQELLTPVKESYSKLPYPNGKWLLQRMFFPVIWWYVKKYYFSKFGKLIHLISMKLGILTKATSPEEKAGERPDFIPAKLPNALAELAANQLKDIDKIQEYRVVLSKVYDRSLNRITSITRFKRTHPPLRYPLLINDRDEVLEACYDKGINLGDWYSQPIAPGDIDQSAFGYEKGSCPNAEEVCDQIINLPTHINMNVIDNDVLIQGLIDVQNELSKK